MISLKPLREFWRVHPDAERALRRWHKGATKAEWRSLAEARQVYPHADAVMGKHEVLTVFNIGGNKYRLVARVRYEFQLVNVRRIMTHAEYDKSTWKD